MIKVGTIEFINKAYDENWMIVRSPGEIPICAKHVPELSPSPELFTRYRNQVHQGTFTKQWFDEVYVPQFLKDLSKNIEGLALLERLCKESETKEIFLCCFCEDERLCHRSIIAGLLFGMKAKIDTNQEYLKYYEMFKQYV